VPRRLRSPGRAGVQLETLSETRGRTPEGADLAHDLVVIGSGLSGVGHLTTEAVEVLRRARVVLCSGYDPGLANAVRALHPSVPVLTQEEGEYRLGSDRPAMYRRIAERALAEARCAPGVVLLHPGSAVVVDAITRHVLRLARAERLSVRIVAGVSSVETVLLEVRYDVAAGLQVVLAQDLVLRRRRLDPGMAAMVLQPGYYDTLFAVGAPRSRPGRFDALRDVLLEAFPPQSAGALVITPFGDGREARTLWFRLEELHRLHAFISPFHTLFVPPVELPAANPAFAMRMASLTDVLDRLEADAAGVPEQQRAEEWFARVPHGIPEGMIRESLRLADAWADRAERLEAGAYRVDAEPVVEPSRTGA
jgi:precorrin-2 methylase